MRSAWCVLSYALLAGLLSSACSGSGQITPPDASSGSSSGSGPGTSGASAGSSQTPTPLDGSLDCSALPIPTIARVCPDGTAPTALYIEKDNECVLEFACPVVELDASVSPASSQADSDAGGLARSACPDPSTVHQGGSCQVDSQTICPSSDVFWPAECGRSPPSWTNSCACHGFWQCPGRQFFYYDTAGCAALPNCGGGWPEGGCDAGDYFFCGCDGMDVSWECGIALKPFSSVGRCHSQLDAGDQ